MMKATQKFDAATLVVWLIENCPVPPGFDARRVGPCIKRYLERLGYSGPLTITALGVLKDIPVEVLGAVSSTGIGLDMDVCGSNSVLSLVSYWTEANPPPANIMVITDPEDHDIGLDLNLLERKMGYNIIKPYPFGPASQCAWESFLLAESLALEDNCIESGESVWVCSVCDSFTVHIGFENFTKHISSEEHAQEYEAFFSTEYDEEEYDYLWPSKWTPPSESPIAYDTTMVMHQPKTCQCFSLDPHMFATPSESALAYDTTMVMHQPKTGQCFSLKPHMSATPSESHGKDEPEPKRKRN